MTRLLLLAALGLSATACHHRIATAGPGMNAKREASLHAEAAAKLHCDTSALAAAYETSVEANYHVYRVDGCGQRYYSILHCTGPVCNWVEGPEQLASAELQCPVPLLARTYQGHVFTLTGCGKQARYELDHGHVIPAH